MRCSNCNATLLDCSKYCHICGQRTEKVTRSEMTMLQVYSRWLPQHQKRVGSATIYNYQAAFKWFSSLHDIPLAKIGIDDLQACMDACPRGKRTKENMKAVAGLLYKWAIPRSQATINMAHYLVVDAPKGPRHVGIPLRELEKIWNILPCNYYARHILAQCYLGFRPSEFLKLRVEDFDSKEMVFIGGGKTVAGTNRVVTVSPKVQALILDQAFGRTSGQFFCKDDLSPLGLSAYRREFYKALQQAGIANPSCSSGRRTYTPHSCRHTFATLIKNAPGSDKDKLELIGHTTGEMLRYYQDVSLSDLRRITDAL